MLIFLHVSETTFKDMHLQLYRIKSCILHQNAYFIPQVKNKNIALK